MTESYCGELAGDDPLWPFLVDHVFARVLGERVASPVFGVFSPRVGSSVYRYQERSSGISVVGKFYGRKCPDADREMRTALLHHELNALRSLRALGLRGPPHGVVRPLASSVEHGWVLVEEYVPGPDLDHYILRAVREGEAGALCGRLDAAAALLADLHGRTADGGRVDGRQALIDLSTAIRETSERQVLDEGTRGRLEALGERWDAAGSLVGPPRVQVHADPSPPHFRDDGVGGLTVIDLELLRPGDPALDLGCLAAELKHLLWWYGGDPWSGEPYIRYLYAAYAGAAQGVDFEWLTHRGRFYMACHELRMCRNGWLSLEHRRQLLREAEACLAL